MKMKTKRITQSERILVSANKNGKMFYVWHKCDKKEPQRCNYKDLAKTIKDTLIRAGKIVEDMK